MQQNISDVNVPPCSIRKRYIYILIMGFPFQTNLLSFSSQEHMFYKVTSQYRSPRQILFFDFTRFNDRLLLTPLTRSTMRIKSDNLSRVESIFTNLFFTTKLYLIDIRHFFRLFVPPKTFIYIRQTIKGTFFVSFSSFDVLKTSHLIFIPLELFTIVCHWLTV